MKTFYLSFEVFYEDDYSETDTKIVNAPNMNMAKLLLEKSLREDGYESIQTIVTKPLTMQEYE